METRSTSIDDLPMEIINAHIYPELDNANSLRLTNKFLAKTLPKSPAKRLRQQLINLKKAASYYFFSYNSFSATKKPFWYRNVVNSPEYNRYYQQYHKHLEYVFTALLSLSVIVGIAAGFTIAVSIGLTGFGLFITGVGFSLFSIYPLSVFVGFLTICYGKIVTEKQLHHKISIAEEKKSILSLQNKIKNLPEINANKVITNEACTSTKDLSNKNFVDQHTRMARFDQYDEVTKKEAMKENKFNDGKYAFGFSWKEFNFFKLNNKIGNEMNEEKKLFQEYIP